MNGPDVITILSVAGVIDPDVSRVSMIADAGGYVSIHTEYTNAAAGDAAEIDRLKTIEAIAAKMVKLQLQDGQIDDGLARQLKGLIRG